MPAQDLSTQSDADWKKAQSRYENYVNALDRTGVDRKTAAEGDQLFLEPIRTKWKIIQTSPATFQSAGNMAKINSDFNAVTESSQKSAFDRSSSGATDLGPLVQKWMTQVTADKASGKASAYEKNIKLMDIRSSIGRANRERTKSADIVRSGLLGITDKDKLAARKQVLQDNTNHVTDLDAKIADLTAQEKTLLSGSTVENPSAQPAAAIAAPAAPDVPTPVDESGKFYNRILANDAAIKANPTTDTSKWYNPGSWGTKAQNTVQESDQAKQLMSDFAKRLAPQIDPASGQVVEGPPAAAPAAVAAAPAIPSPFGGSGVFNLDNYPGGSAAADAAVKASNAAWIARHPASAGGIYISDSPDLSNQTKSEADAMWAAKSASRMTTPADNSAPATDASSYDVQQGAPAQLAAAGKNTPIASQEAYDALGSGDKYYDAQGNLRRKK